MRTLLDAPLSFFRVENFQARVVSDILQRYRFDSLCDLLLRHGLLFLKLNTDAGSRMLTSPGAGHLYAFTRAAMPTDRQGFAFDTRRNCQFREAQDACCLRCDVVRRTH